jgi:dihydrofolate synthase/folylpolyglutamate synthase
MLVTKENILRELFSLERKGINPGLDRIQYLMAQTNSPHKQFPSIHIAGTNGKGTTASLIASILKEAGYKTALYTSPHIKEFNERIRINGNIISDNELIELAQKYMLIGKSINATFFEITTAIAFDYFASQNVDIAVIETGLGGRLDATNVIEPLLSIITSIDIEHTDYLGNTLEQIAFEKGGIIKPNLKTILGDITQPALNILLNICKERNNKVIKIDPFLQKTLEINQDYSINTLITTKNYSYNLITKLIGPHQLINHAIAVSAIEEIANRFPVQLDKIQNGILNVAENSGLRARIELISKNPIVIIDTAHNPAAFKRLNETIKMIWRKDKFNLVFGAMSDKDKHSMLENIKELICELVITQPNSSRAASCNQIAEIAQMLNIKHQIIENPQEAFNYCRSKKINTIVAGSFYLLADINYY